MRTSRTTGALMPLEGFSRIGQVGSITDTPAPPTMWISADLVLVGSSLDMMFLPGTQDTKVGPTWLISVSHQRVRASDAVMARVVRAFDMPAFDEDNHFPGITRSLYCPVEEEYRSACECKITETLVTDVDGYQWTNPVDGPCRGCELARLLAKIGTIRPCPIHS